MHAETLDAQSAFSDFYARVHVTSSQSYAHEPTVAYSHKVHGLCAQMLDAKLQSSCMALTLVPMMTHVFCLASLHARNVLKLFNLDAGSRSL